jgi:hypothetical protein
VRSRTRGVVGAGGENPLATRLGGGATVDSKVQRRTLSYNNIKPPANSTFLTFMPEVIEIPIELTHFQLPEAVHNRLQFLLDRQDSGETLT